MRNAWCLLLALALLWAALPGSGEADPLPGVWIMHHAEMDGEIFTREELLTFGPVSELTLHEDGTAAVSLAGVENTGTYSGQTIRLGQQSYPFRLEDGMLFLEIMGATFVYEKADGAVAPDTELPDPGLLTGFWRIDSWETEGRTRDRSWLDSFGYDEFLDFSEDGILTIQTYENGYLCEDHRHDYAFAGAALLRLDSENLFVFSLEDDALCIFMGNGDSTKIYRRSSREAVPQAPAEDESEEADPRLFSLWELEIMIDSDIIMDREELDAFGFRETIEFSEDGQTTMRMYKMGQLFQEETHAFRSIGSGTLLIEERYIEHYIIEGDTLTIIEPSMTLILRRITEGEAEAAD